VQLLLDTHVLLWWLSDDPRLGPQARAHIGAAGSDVFVSAATAWEIAVKRAAGKLDAPWDVGAELEEEGFLELPIELEHAIAAAELPRHHTDPFDRLLVAQARSEGLWLVTSDDAIRRYDVPWLDAGS
jgi:PIN domain nuclease of toxin-antitoxin system